MANSSISNLETILLESITDNDKALITDTGTNSSLAVTVGDLKKYFSQKTVYLKDIKLNGTYGGTFVSNGWRIRDLNNISGDQSFLTVSAGFTSNAFDNNGSTPSVTLQQFTLEAGTYEIDWSCPAGYVTAHISKLYNVSDSSDQIIGTNEDVQNSSAASTTTRSMGQGSFTITSPKTFDIRHRCGSTKSTNGLGNRTSFGVSEVFTMVKISKIY